MTRFKCDYPQCGRVLERETDKGFSCSSCGHGAMREMPIRNTCYYCGAPIYDNVDPDSVTQCWKCTDDRVGVIGRGEKEKGVEFVSTADMLEKASKEKTNWGEKLAEARKRKGWPQSLLALKLGVTQPFVSSMERGINPLTSAAYDWVRENELSEPIQGIG